MWFMLWFAFKDRIWFEHKNHWIIYEGYLTPNFAPLSMKQEIKDLDSLSKGENLIANWRLLSYYFLILGPEILLLLFWKSIKHHSIRKSNISPIRNIRVTPYLLLCYKTQVGIPVIFHKES